MKIPSPVRLASYLTVILTATCFIAAIASSAGMLQGASNFWLWLGALFLALLTLFSIMIDDTP